MKIFKLWVLILAGSLVFTGCKNISEGAASFPKDISPEIDTALIAPSPPNETASTEQNQLTAFASSETEPPAAEAPLAAYASLLAGDRALLDEAQAEMWWIPSFQAAGMAYEYTYLDLDGDGVVELLIQMADDPCGYNAVFHFEDGKLLCWNSDGMEMSCRDYPLDDGVMVRQYDYSGNRSYTLFRYRAGGEKEDIAFLSAREEPLPGDGTTPCPYYQIDGEEVSQAEFDEQLAALITSRMLDRSVWTAF